MKPAASHRPKAPAALGSARANASSDDDARAQRPLVEARKGRLPGVRSLRSAEILIACAVLAGFNPREAHAQRAAPIERAETNSSIARDSAGDPAAAWRLTETEFQRYQQLLEGPRGRLSAPGVTPVEVLGIEARSMAEREKYAELYVEMMARETDKALAFTRAVHAAWRRRYGDVPVLNHARFNAAREAFGSLREPLPLARMRPGRLMIFTRLDCGACAADVSRALEKVETGKFAGADIYLLGVSPDRDDEIRDWAREHRLSFDDIRKRRLTLNYDQGEFEFVSARLKRSFAGQTVFIERRGDGYEAVSSHDL